MSNVAPGWIQRYRATALAAAIITIIGIWPTLLAPLGRAYVAFCARYLTNAPFGHHYPPLLFAFLAPVGIILLTCIAIVWVRQLAGQRHLDRVLSARRSRSDPRLHRITSIVGEESDVVITTDTRIYAFCNGLIRPRIYLSRGLLDLLAWEEIEAVVRHELHHARRRDPLRFLVSRLARQSAVLFPLLATFDDRVRTNAELAADQAALARVSFDALAGALVKVMRADPLTDHRIILAGLSPTDVRVMALLGRPVSVSYHPHDVFVSLGFAFGLIALLASLAAQSLPLPPACDACPVF